MPCYYWVVGIDRHGQPTETTKPNAESAIRPVTDLNYASRKRGNPEVRRAEYADIEWKPLTEEDE